MSARSASAASSSLLEEVAGGSDIAKHKGRYVGEAVEAEYLRKAGRRKPA
jgi:hypothetical protein